MILAPELETLPWAEQAAGDDACYREQLDYLFEVVATFAPEGSGHILVRPQAPGVKQEPPLPVSVELARGHEENPVLAEAIRDRLRQVLVVQTRVDLVPWGSLRRSEYKSKLVER